jgi:hypothetical protein
VKKGDEGIRIVNRRVVPAMGTLKRDEVRTIKDPFMFGIIFNEMDEEPIVLAHVNDFVRIQDV